VASGVGSRLIVRKTGEDLTGRMTSWADQKLDGFGGLEGFVLKKDSPSCGMERVRLYPEGEGSPTRQGRGIFAAALLERYPLLPVEEEGRLNDPVLRENFIERIFAYRRWRRFVSGDPAPKDLQGFHAASKMALMAHHPEKYRELGRLVAGARKTGFSRTLNRYGEGYMDVLRHRATRRRNTNVLQHLMGHLKRDLDDGDRSELGGLIEEYRRGRLPLIVPITLLRHHFRRHGTEWVLSQTYLNPYPDELMLRNHV